MQNQLRHELQDIISGKGEVRYGRVIQSVAGYLNDGSQPGPETEDLKFFKKQEEARLEEYIHKYSLWLEDIDFSQYVSEGAEQRVYLKDSDYVLKLNDAIYYSSWKDYCHNLLLHNFFFSDSAYELKGFIKEEGVLYAVVEQAFVSITEPTDLDTVKLFLESNGFENTRNNDYYNGKLGVILEDLHDENVLTRNGILYFIDTVFYLTEIFWE